MVGLLGYHLLKKGYQTHLDKTPLARGTYMNGMRFSLRLFTFAFMIRDTNITFWTCMLFGFFGLLACQVEEDLVVEGWKPVYQGEADLSVSSATPRAIVEAGKIYKYGPYILVGESGQGIHVFDNDPSNPVSIAFVNVPLNEDMAIQNDVMFIDIGRDVVAVDVSDWVTFKKLAVYQEFIIALMPCILKVSSDILNV